jgi:hypothetical protein
MVAKYDLKVQEMPPIFFLFGTMLPWFAGLRLTVSYWEAVAAALPRALAAPHGDGTDSTVTLLPTRARRRVWTGGTGGELLQFVPLQPDKVRRYPSR